jgi:hypothetical protein
MSKEKPDLFQRVFKIVLGSLMGIIVLVIAVSYLTTSPPPPGKIIKGNRASLIYHIPGCQNYDDVTEENIVWFSTIDEAKAAGYRQARNCNLPY